MNNDDPKQPQQALQTSEPDENITDAMPAPDPDEKRRNDGASWFLWIGVLSLLNSLLIYADRRFIFGLGVTSILDTWVSDSTALRLACSALFAAFYVAVFVLFTRRKFRWAYPLGYVTYLADTLVLAVCAWEYGEYVGELIFHAVLLAVLYFKNPFLSRSEGTAPASGGPRGLMTAVCAVLTVSTLAVGGFLFKVADLANATGMEYIRLAIADADLPRDYEESGLRAESLRLDTVARTISFEYSYPGYERTAADADSTEIWSATYKESFLETWTQDVQEDTFTETCCREGLTFIYTYRDCNDSLLYEVRISPEDYNSLLPAAEE